MAFRGQALPIGDLYIQNPPGDLSRGIFLQLALCQGADLRRLHLHMSGAAGKVTLTLYRMRYKIDL